MGVAQDLVRHGSKHVQGWENTVRHLWRKCCEFDGIEPVSSFVVFSDANPYVKFYNTAVGKCQEAKNQLEHGGYVGLKIVNGKAVIG